MFKANPEIQKKVDEIFKDSDTVDWIATITSESAKINYQKHLAEYLIYRKSTIKKLVSNFKKDENKEIKNNQAFVNEMLKRLASGTVANYVSAIKSRMQYDGIPFTRSVKIPHRTYHPTVEGIKLPFFRPGAGRRPTERWPIRRQPTGAGRRSAGYINIRTWPLAHERV